MLVYRRRKRILTGYAPGATSTFGCEKIHGSAPALSKDQTRRCLLGTTGGRQAHSGLSLRLEGAVS